MVFIQSRNLPLGLCITVFFLRFVDFTKSHERNILHQMNRPALKRETVVLDCNGNLTDEYKDTGWRKDGILLFNFSPVMNRIVINYTSSRMQVDPQNPRKLQITDVQLSDAGLYMCFPLEMQWNLTIEDTNPDMKYVYIIPLVSGAVAISVIIFCVVSFHRKWKNINKEASNHRHTDDETQPNGRRMNRTPSSQYFERFNSVYGQIQF